jgi:hypothetical protein
MHCEHEKIYCGKKWAAPRKNNDKAWKLIESGDIWWDKRRMDRPLRAKMAGGGWFFNRGSHGRPDWFYWRKIPEGMRFLKNHPKVRNKNV